MNVYKDRVVMKRLGVAMSCYTIFKKYDTFLKKYDPSLKKYNFETLSIDKGSLLAYRVLRDSIDICAYGLGYPIDIWAINNEGAKRKLKAEIEKLEERCCEWLQDEEGIFENYCLKK